MFMSTSELAIKMMNMTMIMIIMVVVMTMMILTMKGINLGLRSWLRPVTLAGEAEGGGAILSDPVCNYQGFYDSDYDYEHSYYDDSYKLI